MRALCGHEKSDPKTGYDCLKCGVWTDDQDMDADRSDDGGQREPLADKHLCLEAKSLAETGMTLEAIADAQKAEDAKKAEWEKAHPWHRPLNQFERELVGDGKDTGVTDQGGGGVMVAPQTVPCTTCAWSGDSTHIYEYQKGWVREKYLGDVILSVGVEAYGAGAVRYAECIPPEPGP